MEHKKYITVHRQFWLKNRTFRVNEQHCITDKVVQKKWCGGCRKYKDKLYYMIEIDGVNYLVSAEYVVESDDKIEPEDEDFRNNRFRNVGNKESDYDPIRVNNDPNEIWRQSQDIKM